MSNSNFNAAANEVLALNQRLLDSIAAGDWAAYEALCAPDLTCFEPETLGHLIEGMAFHKFYFDLGASNGPRNVTMASPHVRLLGNDAAIVSYTRLVQRLNAENSPVTSQVEETRVWQRCTSAVGGVADAEPVPRTASSSNWKLVHVHRSPPG